MIKNAGARLVLERGDVEQMLAAKKVALISSWTKTPFISKSLSQYLFRLHEIGFTSAVVNTSSFEDELSWPHGLPESTVVFRRANIGYDFGSWAAALEAHPVLREKEQVLLTNDSMVGPFEDLTRLREAADASGADIFSLTESFQMRHHPQSFFLLFKNGILQDSPWQKFFSGVREQGVKEDIIGAYEFGVAKNCERFGYSWEPLISAAAADAGKDNPTLASWFYLLTNGAPFVKRNILTEPEMMETSLEMALSIANIFNEDVRLWLPRGYQLPSPVLAALPFAEGELLGPEREQK